MKKLIKVNVAMAMYIAVTLCPLETADHPIEMRQTQMATEAIPAAEMPDLNRITKEGLEKMLNRTGSALTEPEKDQVEKLLNQNKADQAAQLAIKFLNAQAREEIRVLQLAIYLINEYRRSLPNLDVLPHEKHMYEDMTDIRKLCGLSCSFIGSFSGCATIPLPHPLGCFIGCLGGGVGELVRQESLHQIANGLQSYLDALHAAQRADTMGSESPKYEVLDSLLGDLSGWRQKMKKMRMTVLWLLTASYLTDARLREFNETAKAVRELIENRFEKYDPELVTKLEAWFEQFLLSYLDPAGYDDCLGSLAHVKALFAHLDASDELNKDTEELVELIKKLLDLRMRESFVDTLRAKVLGCLNGSSSAEPESGAGSRPNVIGRPDTGEGAPESHGGDTGEPVSGTEIGSAGPADAELSRACIFYSLSLDTAVRGPGSRSATDSLVTERPPRLPLRHSSSLRFPPPPAPTQQQMGPSYADGTSDSAGALRRLASTVLEIAPQAPAQQEMDQPLGGSGGSSSSSAGGMPRGLGSTVPDLPGSVSPSVPMNDSGYPIGSSSSLFPTLSLAPMPQIVA